MSLKKLVKRLVPKPSFEATTERFWRQVQEHERFIYGVALRYTGHTFDAEDLVQQTLEMAFKRYAQLRKPAHFKRWIFVIMRNIHLKAIRRPAAVAYQDSFDEQTDYIDILSQTAQRDPSALYEQKAVSRTVREALASLSEPYQTVLMLHFMEGYRYREISRILDIPVGTVMSRLSRGKQHLKKALLQQAHQKKTQRIRWKAASYRS